MSTARKDRTLQDLAASLGWEFSTKGPGDSDYYFKHDDIVAMFNRRGNQGGNMYISVGGRKIPVPRLQLGRVKDFTREGYAEKLMVFAAKRIVLLNVRRAYMLERCAAARRQLKRFDDALARFDAFVASDGQTAQTVDEKIQIQEDNDV